MELLVTQPGGRGPVLNVVFGSGGLIGSELVSQIKRHGPTTQTYYPLTWSDRDAMRGELNTVIREVERLACEWGNSGVRVNWVYAAGKCGFRATDEEIGGEFDSFCFILDQAGEFAREHDRCLSTFQMLSSAGGVYEGSSHVHRDVPLAPCRPYAKLKIMQEQALADCQAPLVKQVFRLTSVYGHQRPGTRRGLITTMLFNGLQHRVTPIFGRLDTLRDFTFTEDIARFLTHRLFDRTPRDTVDILAACRPSSIFEVRTCIERVLNRAIYVACSCQTSNARNITFASDTMPDGWGPTPLEQNVRRILYEADHHVGPGQSL